MATLSASVPPAVARERQFFFYMALAMFGITIVGFLRFLFMGLSSFASPWWVHVHGISMMGWLVLYTLQNGLVARGSLDLHRRLGVLAAAYSVWVPLVGAMVLRYNIVEKRTPPFFSGEFLIAMDGLTVLAFVALTWAAIAMRNRADWHKRLMLSGTILLIQPGLGRLVPMSMLGTDIPYLVFPGHLLFFAAALVYDWRARGGIHTAYLWGLAALVAVTALPIMIVTAPPLVSLVATLKG